MLKPHCPYVLPAGSLRVRENSLLIPELVKLVGVDACVALVVGVGACVALIVGVGACVALGCSEARAVGVELHAAAPALSALWHGRHAAGDEAPAEGL